MNKKIEIIQVVITWKDKDGVLQQTIYDNAKQAKDALLFLKETL